MPPQSAQGATGTGTSPLRRTGPGHLGNRKGVAPPALSWDVGAMPTMEAGRNAFRPPPP